MKSRLSLKSDNPVFVCLCACLCCLLWGSAFPLIKLGYSELKVASDDFMSQILFAGIRFAIAGALTIIFGSILGKSVLKISRRGLYKIPVLSLFQTIIQYLFFYIGLSKTTGTKASVLNSTSVFFSVLIAFVVLKERLTVRKGIGCFVGFAGVVLINLSNNEAASSGAGFTGEIMIVLSSLSYAVSSVLIKQFSKNENTVALSGYQFLFGGLVMSAIGIACGGRLNFCTTRAVAILIYLAFLSAIAYTLWGILLKYNDVSRVTIYSFMTPAFGCVLSALILRENVLDNLVKTVVSLVLVCLGIYLVNSVNSTVKEKKE